MQSPSMRCLVHSTAFLGCLLIGLLSELSLAQQKSVPDNFKTENLVAWCIVPFDAKNRGPAQRAEMVRRLGLKRVAYDWRKKHIPEFEHEILEYKKNGIEYFAFWGWHDSMKALIRKHDIKPQIWQMYRGKLTAGSDEENVRLIAQQFLPVVEQARSLGLKFGIYNHGGWAGEPANMVAVCEYLRNEHRADNVGIVYNFHHGHKDIADFEAKFKILQPYLFCLNLNGMVSPEELERSPQTSKIRSIGSGSHEAGMIRSILKHNYDGPIGVLGHRAEMDAEKSLGLNVDGLRNLIEDL